MHLPYTSAADYEPDVIPFLSDQKLLLFYYLLTENNSLVSEDHCSSDLYCAL